jgi:hypothetical protein
MTGLTGVRGPVTADYRQGFAAEIDSGTLPPGLNEGALREISRRNE